jgi:hypothetical protein
MADGLGCYICMVAGRSLYDSSMYSVGYEEYYTV